MKTYIEKVRTYGGALTVGEHDVSFYYRLPPGIVITDEMKMNMKREAMDRAKHCISEEYNQGELNYETDEFQATGWWSRLP